MVEETRKLAENVILKFFKEMGRNDAAAMAALFTDDAIMLPANSEMVRGRKGIEKFWRALLESAPHEDVVPTILELDGSGDTFYEVGNLTVNVHQKGQKPVEVKSKHIIILKHTASGWKIQSGIWNLNTPT